MPVRPGIVPHKLRGFWTREQRLYFVLSLAIQRNPDQKRAERLLSRMRRGQLTPEQAVSMLLPVPYVPGGDSLIGADCWGIVELWYCHVLGIDLSDRADHPAGHGGMQAGFEAAAHWKEIAAPEDHGLVIMRAHGFEAGHVGIFYRGSVLHSQRRSGCVYEPINRPFIRSKITRFLKHT